MPRQAFRAESLFYAVPPTVVEAFAQPILVRYPDLGGVCDATATSILETQVKVILAGGLDNQVWGICI